MDLVEVFTSIQGEGAFTGTPANFIRLAGCNLQCEWCDTDHKLRFMQPVEGIVASLDRRFKHVIITGGEPLLQKEYYNLSEQLIAAGFTVHVETNGTIPIKGTYGTEFDYITVSPKSEHFPQTWGFELKLVYTGQSDDYLNRLLGSTQFLHYFLQPCHTNTGPNTKETVEAVLRNPEWRLSLQTHKILLIR